MKFNYFKRNIFYFLVTYYMRNGPEIGRVNEP